eukprot:5536535-Amphidinium_carterae.2
MSLKISNPIKTQDYQKNDQGPCYIRTSSEHGQVHPCTTQDHNELRKIFMSERTGGQQDMTTHG